MHSNPTATRSLCCRSRRVEWLPPLHSASLYTFIFFFLPFPLSLSLFFLFLPFRTWPHSRYCIARAKYGRPLLREGRKNRFPLHTVTRGTRTGGGKGGSTRNTGCATARNAYTSFRLDPTHPGSTFYPRLSTTRWFHGEVGNGRLSRFYRERTNSPPDATLIIRSFV